MDTNNKELQQFMDSLDELDGLVINNHITKYSLKQLKDNLLSLYLLNKHSESNVPEYVATLDDKKTLIEFDKSNKIFSRKNFIILNIICWLFCFIALFMLLSSINYRSDSEKVLNEFKEEALKERQLSYDEGYVLGVQENSIYWNNVLNHINENISKSYDLNNDVANEYLLAPMEDKIKDYTSHYYTDKLNESYESYLENKEKLDSVMLGNSGNGKVELDIADYPLSNGDVLETTDINAFISNGSVNVENYTNTIISKFDLTDEKKEIVYNYIYTVTVDAYKDGANQDIVIDWITLSDDMKVSDALDSHIFYDLLVENHQ